MAHDSSSLPDAEAGLLGGGLPRSKSRQRFAGDDHGKSAPRRRRVTRSLAALLLFVAAGVAAQLFSARGFGGLLGGGRGTGGTQLLQQTRGLVPLETLQRVVSEGPARAEASTLVVYVFAFSDEEYLNNLLFFLETGVGPDDGVDYVLVVQEGKGVLREVELPELPANVRVLRRPNACFDWGTFGWVADLPEVKLRSYKNVVLLNSSVRGPFLPPYWPKSLHWTHALTSKLNQETRMVGSTISCEGSYKGGVLTGEKRQNPHVQSYLVAMDQEAFSLLEREGSVLRCWETYHDAVWHAEMGSSAALIRKGYNIASLQMRYQGVDFRDPATWSCNAGLNPYGDHMYDGIDLNPIEVLFVKVKEYLLEANWTTSATATRYARWIESGRRRAHVVGGVGGGIAGDNLVDAHVHESRVRAGPGAASAGRAVDLTPDGSGNLPGAGGVHALASASGPNGTAGTPTDQGFVNATTGSTAGEDGGGGLAHLRPGAAGFIDDPSTNAYVESKEVLRAGKTISMQNKGPRCFDAAFYRSKNPDLPAAWTPLHLWTHLVEHGQHEGRVFRFRCPPPGTPPQLVLSPPPPPPTGCEGDKAGGT